MILEIKENSACILVEKSPQTDQFLPAIKELLIGVLLEKSHQNEEKFRFNIAYFDKEPTFWAEQVTDCSTENASSAAQWIRSWTPSTVDQHSGQIKPRTMMAIIAAFNDPFVGAIYLLSASAPYENPGDVVTHAKYSSKDRPIHVLFLTSRSHMDEKAMEILHLAAKKTDGSFHVVYYDENGSKTGRLIKIPAVKRHHGTLMLRNDSVSSQLETPTSVQDMPSFDFGNDEFRGHAFALDKVHRAHSGGSFRDLIVCSPQTVNDHHKPIGHDITIPLGTSNTKSMPNLWDDTKLFHHKEPQFHLENTHSRDSALNIDHSPSGDSEMDEIKKHFVEYYWRKRSSDHVRHTDHHGTHKAVDFEAHTSHRRSSTSSISSSSSSISSSDEEKIKSPNKSVFHRLSHQPSPDLSTGRNHITPLGSRPPTARTSSIPVTIYSKTHYSPVIPKQMQSPHPKPSPVVTSRSARPAWRPPTARRHIVSTPKLAVSNANTATVRDDRSRAWMNRWMNEWVSRHEPKHGPNKNHAAIQANVEKDIIVPVLHRSKSEPRKLQMTTYTQTPHEEKRVEEEIHTIRDLLVKNNNILDSLARGTNAKKMTPRKTLINDLEHLTITDHNLTHVANVPSHRIHDHLTGHKIAQTALERKEEIRRQQEQACYKAMYHKLVGDMTRRNVPEKHPPPPPQSRYAFVNGDKMELIAKLPHTSSIFQG